MAIHFDKLVQAEESTTSIDSMSQDFGELDPRSPTRAFQRTPIPTGSLSDSEQSLGFAESIATISDFAENSPKILAAGAFSSPVLAANAKRKCILISSLILVNPVLWHSSRLGR